MRSWATSSIHFANPLQGLRDSLNLLCRDTKFNVSLSISFVPPFSLDGLESDGVLVADDPVRVMVVVDAAGMMRCSMVFRRLRVFFGI